MMTRHHTQYDVIVMDKKHTTFPIVIMYPEGYRHIDDSHQLGKDDTTAPKQMKTCVYFVKFKKTTFTNTILQQCSCNA